jgi:hypothetical protein
MTVLKTLKDMNLTCDKGCGLIGIPDHDKLCTLVDIKELKQAAIEWLKFFQSQPDPDAFLGERIIIKKFFDITSDDLL